MATQKIKCTSVGAFNSFGAGGTSDKAANMDPDNGDGFSGGYIAEGSTNGGTIYQNFHITAPAARTAITSWTQITGGGKNANQAWGGHGMYDEAVGWRSGPSDFNYDVFIWGTQDASLGWASPTDAQLDTSNLTMMVYHRNDGDGTHPLFVNYMYSNFVYTPADMSFISIWNLVLPVIGAGLLFRDMSRINAWLMRNTDFSFEEHEYKEAYKQIRDYKFSKQFDLWLPRAA